MTRTRERKAEHLRIAAQKDVQATSVRTGFDDVDLIHRALPELSLEEVEPSVTFFGHKLMAPIVIGAMTGGTTKGARVNASLAEAAEALGLAMAIGSQRVALETPRLASTFKVARKRAPHAFLIGSTQTPSRFTSILSRRRFSLRETHVTGAFYKRLENSLPSFQYQSSLRRPAPE
jgi:isopentenyl-diphosphate delta-isomerase